MRLKTLGNTLFGVTIEIVYSLIIMLAAFFVCLLFA